MPHAHNCISKACTGCGPKSEIGIVQKKLAHERQRNTTLLEQVTKIREELEKANETIERLKKGDST